MLYIFNVTLLTPEQTITDGAILTDGVRIIACGSSAEVTRPTEAVKIDGRGLYLAPGFIDLQFNGAFGHDFTAEPESIWQVGNELPRYGVTAFLPTVITAPLENIAAAQHVLNAGAPQGYRGAQPLGLHVEGPFLNPEKKGAHNLQYLRLPDLEAVQDWSPASGVRLVTLAPELTGAAAVIDYLKEHGILVSAGHSTLSYEQAQEAFRLGVRCGTHLFNAMPPLNHRAPGLAGALLDAPDIGAGMIVDGLHVHPAMVALAWRLKNERGLFLVTDAMAAAGMSPGDYQLSGLTVHVDGETARLDDGTLAGSLLSMDAALRNLIAFTGCSLAEALPALTRVPAEVIGMPQKGRLQVGCDADLILLSPDLKVQATAVAGELVYSTF